MFHTGTGSLAASKAAALACKKATCNVNTSLLVNASTQAAERDITTESSYVTSLIIKISAQKEKVYIQQRESAAVVAIILLCRCQIYVMPALRVN